MSHRVLLVEDDPDVIGVLCAAFDEPGIELSVARSGRAALDAVADPPDLIVLDVGLPDILGTEVARRLRGAGLTAPILMLTALDTEQDVVAGLESGATAYVTKPVRPSEVRAWARALLRTSAGANRSFAGLELDPERRLVRLLDHAQTVRLTPVQVRLLAVLMDAAGNPLPRDQLLRRVWDIDFDPGTQLVEVHVYHLRRKLAALGADSQLETIRKLGYRIKPVSLKNL